MAQWLQRGVGALAVVLVAGSATFAVPVSLPQTILPGVGFTVWDVNGIGGTDGGPFGGNCNGSAALAIDDAVSASGAGDAYDVAWSVWIDGSPFVAPGVVDLSGTTLLAGPVVMSGLNVSVQYFFSTSHQAARVLVFLQNPSLVPAAVTVQVPVNFGSDEDTQVEGTSSGDTTVTTGDRWVVTSDGSPPSDPVNTTVFYGPGSPAVVPASYTQTVFDCADPDGIGATFNVSVPASSARALMFFAGLGDIAGTGNSIMGALSSASLFDSVASLQSSTDLLSGVTIDTSQSALILNWEGLSVQLPQQQGTLAAPLLSMPVLALWAVVLAWWGGLLLRRARTGARTR